MLGIWELHRPPALVLTSLPLDTFHSYIPTVNLMIRSLTYLLSFKLPPDSVKMPKYTETQLLKAVKYSQQNPDMPLTRIAALYEVNLSTLRRRKLGLTLPPSQAHRDEQLFSPGEEQAIAKHCIALADYNFPISHDLLKRLAQDILNARVQPKETANSEQPQAKQIGEDWTNRFLKRNPDVKTRFVRYQERSRLAVSNNIELQLDFLKQLADIVRRLKVHESNIWSCDEKAITIGLQSVKTKVIVRAGTSKAVAGSDGNREFVSVLETISAAGQVIPPFIVSTGSIHGESCYPGPGPKLEATFAMSKSGYMDNELCMEYMKQHFEPHTRRIATMTSDGKEVVQARILILDGHASHLNYSMLAWALENDIHIISLPSNSTHILQPLDVGCFGLLQRTYERNLGNWVIANPIGLVDKTVFLEILGKTREEVYTEEIIRSAWRASNCWPVDLDIARRAKTPTSLGALSNPPGPPSNPAGSTTHQKNVSDKVTNPIMDTPQELRRLERNFKNIVLSNCPRKELLDAFYAFVDKSNEKLCMYRDIAPRPHTHTSLRNGKVRMKAGAVGQRDIPGAARKVISFGLEQLELAEKKKVLEKQRIAAEKEKATEENRQKKALADNIYKMEMAKYEAERDIWETNCNKIEEDWRIERDSARAARKRVPKKPQMPPRPIKPSKTRVVRATHVPGTASGSLDGVDEATESNNSEGEIETAVESMKELEVEQFADVCGRP